MGLFDMFLGGHHGTRRHGGHHDDDDHHRSRHDHGWGMVAALPGSAITACLPEAAKAEVRVEM